MGLKFCPFSRVWQNVAEWMGWGYYMVMYLAPFIPIQPDYPFIQHALSLLVWKNLNFHRYMGSCRYMFLPVPPRASYGPKTLCSTLCNPALESDHHLQQGGWWKNGGLRIWVQAFGGGKISMHSFRGEHKFGVCDCGGGYILSMSDFRNSTNPLP